MTTVWAAVPAAGRGTRFGGPVPKQYLQLAGRTIVEHSLSALLSHPLIGGAMVAIAPDDADWPVSLTTVHGKPIITCIGGTTRAESVRNALAACDCDIAVVHDAARPLLTHEDLDRVLHTAMTSPETGAILATPLADTLKRADVSGHIAETVDRSTLWRALTPQVFARDALLAALEQGITAGWDITDEASAMERAGVHPVLVAGRADNIKVTTAADLQLAEAVLEQRSSMP